MHTLGKGKAIYDDNAIVKKLSIHGLSNDLY